MFARENFAILVAIRAPGPNGTTPGELVQAGPGLNITGDINFSQGSFLISPADAYLNTIEGSLAATLVSSMLFQVFQDTSTQLENSTRLIFVVYDVNSTLFQDPNPNIDGTGSVILSFLRSPQQGPPPMDLEETVKFHFQANQVRKSYILCFYIVILCVAGGQQNQWRQCYLCVLGLHPKRYIICGLNHYIGSGIRHHSLNPSYD
jgi:hypothetical protein